MTPRTFQGAAGGGLCCRLAVRRLVLAGVVPEFRAFALIGGGARGRRGLRLLGRIGVVFPAHVSVPAVSVREPVLANRATSLRENMLALHMMHKSGDIAALPAAGRVRGVPRITALPRAPHLGLIFTGLLVLSFCLQTVDLLVVLAAVVILEMLGDFFEGAECYIPMHGTIRWLSRFVGRIRIRETAADFALVRRTPSRRICRTC